MKIGIIGAGISGLVTAKTFLQKGHEVTLFERSGMLGGVWDRARSYPGVTTQTTRDEYAFTDFPMPTSYPEWPSGREVQEYLESYARRFGVFDKIHLRAEVTGVERRGDGRRGWTIRVESVDNKRGSAPAETHDVDSLVVCNGVFNAPYVPRVEGADEFVAAGGEILHSSEFTDAARIAGKRVVVVGFAKSATDIATGCVDRAQETTLVYREVNWKVPRFLNEAVNLKHLLFSRAAEALFPYHTQSASEKLLHRLARPVVWANWRLLETLLRRQFHLDEIGMVPKHGIEEQISCSLGVEPVGFYALVREGKLKTKQATLRRFGRGAVELSTGERLNADLVIFGTGYIQGAPFLPEAVRRQVTDEEGNFRLYRHIIHPDVPDLAFNGYNSGLFSQLTAEVGARWIAELAEGNLRLPGRADMLAEIDQVLRWIKTERKSLLPFKGTCIGQFNFHYLDALLRDMGGRLRARNPLADGVLPISPKLYGQLLASIPSHPVARTP